MDSNSPISYEKAGVDINAGNDFAAFIKKSVSATKHPHVLGGIGGFASLFQLDINKFNEPVLVSSTDGVGTKLIVAQMMNYHATIGIDLVAMCVNDLIVTGATPLFFLDYYASGKLHQNTAQTVITGIIEGCNQGNLALIGGETAELPSMYSRGVYDLAGFAVGVLNKPDIIDGKTISDGDLIIGLPSSGLHSNGFSLVRKLFFEIGGLTTESMLPTLGDLTLGEELIKPTRIYVPQIKRLQEEISIKGIAHITGGGITENLPRILPPQLGAVMQRDAWQMPPIFTEIQTRSKLSELEMFRTFNCGIGMIIIIQAQDASIIANWSQECGEPYFTLGHITASNQKVTYQ